MWTLLYSARYAKPELEIPEGVFYNGIPGYSIYVGKRDMVHPGRMLNIMLYDNKEGNEKTRIIRADSGRITADASQTFLTWKLYKGQSFENMTTPSSPLDERPTTFAKERFSYKEIVILFDTSFKMQDEGEMKSRFVGKNLSQLEYAIDTVTRSIDSIRRDASEQMMSIQDQQTYSYELPSRLDTSQQAQKDRKRILSAETSEQIDIDSLMNMRTLGDSLNRYRQAASSLLQMRNESESRLYIDKEAFFDYRTNRMEWHKKFTFPVACLVFFFIGAPLGDIIRKGGLGMPIIASVVFFIIYYIIDTFGHNMISSEQMGVVSGMWISSFVLAPVGIFLTWQATRDSASLNMEAYIVFFRKLFGTARVRKLEVRELILEEINYTQALEHTLSLKERISELRNSDWISKKWLVKRFLFSSWLLSPSESLMQELFEQLEALISELRNSRERMIIAKLQDMPILERQLVPMSITNNLPLKSKPLLLKLSNIIFIITLLPLWILSIRRHAYLRDIKQTEKLLNEIETEIRKAISKGC